jgi:predicted O-methyltransferase YrrM
LDGVKEPDAFMLTRKNIVKGLRDPALLLVWLRRFFIMGGALRDPECMHLVRAWSSGKLPRVGLREIFPGIEACSMVSVRKPESRTIGWSLDLQELIHILSVAKYTNAKRVLEIGTFDGFTALNLAANLADGGEVCTLDLPQDGQSRLGPVSNVCDSGIVGSKFRGEKELNQIRQLWADSTTADWKEFGSPFDLILIDGCHDYPYVKSDSANAIKHLRPGGVIIWHDYGQFADVSRAVDELAREFQIVAIIGTRLACHRSLGTHVSPDASVSLGAS